MAARVRSILLMGCILAISIRTYAQWEIIYPTTDLHRFLTKAVIPYNSTHFYAVGNNIAVPVRFSVENIERLYFEKIRSELDLEKLGSWYNWMEDALFCLEHNIELEQGLRWAEKGINQAWIGRPNFQIDKTKADILRKLNRTYEADSLMGFAIKYTSSVFDLHNYGRWLIEEGRINEAIDAFTLNYKRFPDYWVTSLGMARALAQKGEYKKALKYARTAKATILKNELWVRHESINRVIKKLESNEKPANYMYHGLEQEF